MRNGLIAIAALCLPLAAGCEKDDDKKSGKALGVPLVEPPVKNNLPTGFTGGAALAPGDATSVFAALKDYIYPTNGFVGPVDRLRKIDERMAELNKRAEGSERTCTGEAAKTFTPAGAMGDGSTFALQLQCQENVSAPAGESIKEAQVAFGIDADTFNLVERTASNTGGVIMVLVKEPMAGTSAETWELRYRSATDPNAGGKDGITWLHIKSSEGSVELATAGNASTEGATSCGVQMRSNKDLIYVAGSLAANGPCSDPGTYCADAKTLTAVDVAQCQAAGITTFSLTAITPAMATASLESAKALAAKTIEGYGDFNSAKE